MPIKLKVLVSIFTLLIAVTICFVDPKANNAGPDWLWCIGKNDPVRNLLCKSDGTLRRFAKVGILSFFGLVLLILWFVIP